MGWTSGFLEITQKSLADALDMRYSLSHICCSHMAKTGFLMKWLVYKIAIAAFYSLLPHR